MNTNKPILIRGTISVRPKRRVRSASRTSDSVRNLFSSSVKASSCIALRCAIQAAAIALQSQTDEFGEPLILHAIRDSNHFRTVQDRIAVLTEAVRHYSNIKHKGFCHDECAIPSCNIVEGSTCAWCNGSADIVSFPQVQMNGYVKEDKQVGECTCLSTLQL